MAIVTFAGCGDAFGSGGRFQACIHVRPGPGRPPVLLDCGATSLTALKQAGLEPGEVGAVFVSHLHGDHFGGLPFLILDGQFSGRTAPLAIAGPPGTRQRLATAMECLFPGSTQVRRRFEVTVTELAAGHSANLAGVEAQAWEASHPSGAPALILRLDLKDPDLKDPDLEGPVIAYTGDTAWTPAIAEAARHADLLIAEAYYWDKPVPHHLRYTDLTGHEITACRVILTHLSADMLDRQPAYETARDGLAVTI